MVDLGEGVTAELFSCRHGTGLTGAIIRFPRPEGHCDGYVSWCPECSHPCWRLLSLDPLHLEPSVKCHTHGEEEHGFIRGGRWEPA